MFRRLSLACTLAFAVPASGQTLYSIAGTAGDPTDEETFYLELINRARANPAAEGERLRTTTDPEVVSSVDFFDSDLTMMAQEMSALPAVPPLAFNAQLINASRGHSLDQFNNQFQGHDGTNGSTPGSRVSAAGYSFQAVTENVFSYAESVFHGHAGFEIDWGPGPGNMQTGRGHRVSIHSASVREAGIGVVLGTNGSVGPQVVTQNFAATFAATPFLTGVAYYDSSGDDFYSLGEGLGGIAVTVTGANFSAHTTASGAFTVPLPGNGTYSVRFAGHGIDETGTVTVTNGHNVKLDLQRTATPTLIAGSTTPAAGSATAYSTTSVGGATRYELQSYQRNTATPAEPAENSSAVVLDVEGGYSVVQSSVRAQGASAFNLRTLTGSQDQVITLDRQFYAGSGATLTFASRHAAAFPNQTARVQISTDAGATWTDLFAQPGAGNNGESSFSTRSVSLAAYEGTTFKLRFVYSFSSGSFFTSGNGVGWYVDDIQLPNCEELTAEPARDLGAATTFTYTPAAVGSYMLQVVQFNLAHRLGATEPLLLTANATTGPVVSQQPASTAVSSGGSASLTVTASNTSSFRWQRNGFDVSGGTAATLDLTNVSPASTGLYHAILTGASGTTTTSSPAIVGLTTSDKLVGLGQEFPDIPHSETQKIYDQILLQGSAGTFTADSAQGQITRLSYIDLNDDIVQVEYAGPGSVSIVLAGSSGPATPVKYQQGTAYMKGHAGIVVTGATEASNLTIFSVGRGTAVNQALFSDSITYDGMADIAFVAIHSSNGKFGGLRTANASYWSTEGFTGVYAPGVEFNGPVFVHDIEARDTATPVLKIGSALDRTWITGGDLDQANDRAVQVSGLTELKFADGVTSHYKVSAPDPSQFLVAKQNQARLERDGADVTADLVVNP